MSLASKRIPVILCCAQEDAPHLWPLVVHLEKEGYKVRLIEGIEDDPYLLGSTLDRQLGAALVVACLSDALGPSQFRRIEGVYNARKGPDHWLETIFVEPDETLAMAEGVRAAVAKTKDQRPTPKPRADPKASNGRRDVVGVTNLSAVGTDAIPNTNSSSDRPAELPLGTPSPVTDGDPPPPVEPTTDPSGDSLASGSMAAGSMAAGSMAAGSMVAAKPQTPSWVAPLLFLIFLAVAGTVVLVLLQEDQQDSSSGDRGAPSLAQDAQTGHENEGDSASSGPPVTQPTVSPDPDPDPEASRIVEAIQSGDMRAVDLILIANTSELSAWRDASTRCRRKSVNGVRGWRLPTLDELETIRKARMVSNSNRYWSSTLATKVGAGKDHVYVLDLGNETIEPMSKDTADVRVLCVRAALEVGG